MIKTRIFFNDKQAKVTKQGQLVTGSLNFSTPIQKDMDAVDTAFNFFKPQSGKILIITEVVVNARRSVAVAGSLIEIYEATSETDTTVATQTFKFDLPRQGIVPLTGLNTMISEGAFLNGKCDSAVVLLTISGYFAPV